MSWIIFSVLAATRHATSFKYIILLQQLSCYLTINTSTCWLGTKIVVFIFINTQLIICYINLNTRPNLRTYILSSYLDKLFRFNGRQKYSCLVKRHSLRVVLLNQQRHSQRCGICSLYLCLRLELVPR